ncbi:AAA family ATPase [Corynebacterium casei]|uniref:AAA family ATPase n=1 Tax=Corynebacterium casei TaxID=160386 RepID=UPI002647C3E6|nr:AAA family ATPase [Corynebacterium casei]MDN5800469.1 AAA family ATPase [Corynebacterium casei]MDN5923058.1 AAA family ATPase [Corynebacterium casei]MDN6263849.1 AAA family ATPase [Corynebacterium casei]MDN6274002.1 AAA family ATPase [Corynebacterium casei]MDN6286423.1 AAA family ATPase [Corynebacterium casei]
MIVRSIKFLSRPRSPLDVAESSKYFDGAATIPGVRRALIREQERGAKELDWKLDQVVPADESGQRVDSEWAWKLPLVKYIKSRGGMRFSEPVTLIAGDNGSGKSTFLESVALNLGFSVVGGRYGDSDAKKTTGTEPALSWYMLCELNEPILRGFYLRSETHMGMLENESGEKAANGRNHLDPSFDLNSRSHGESIFDILGEHVDGKGLYIFDEPEAGLSAVRQMALLAEIEQAAARGGQFIIATHSPILLGARQAQILEIGEDHVGYPTWEETEAVRATKEFFTNPRAALDLVFGDSLHPDLPGASAAARYQDAEETDRPHNKHS